MSSPSRTALPPLNALRAFEAAARHSNFARAAAELHVTPGALSHQIRALESLVGASLFERAARGVALTPAGRLLQPGLASGFAQIREAVAALRANAASQVVVVSTPPGFTSKWLAPRLHRFAAAHPEVELRVASSPAYANFVRDGVDIAVRNRPHAEAADPALQVETLVEDGLAGVCSPQLLQRGRALNRLPLIHDDQLGGRPGVPTWADWFAAAGLPPPDVTRGLRFSSGDHAIEAALQGAGLLLTHALLVHDEVVGGRLVMPLAAVLPAHRDYVLTRPKAVPLRPAVAAFAGWLTRELGAARTWLAGMATRRPALAPATAAASAHALPMPGRSKRAPRRRPA